VAAATRDAERHAAKDKARRALVDARNEAESMLYQSGRQLKEFGDKVPADVKARVQAASDALQAAAAGEDAAAIRAAADALREASTAIGQAMYGAAGAGAGPQQPGGGGGDGGGPAGGSKTPPPEPGVYDAEFTDSS
jgi:molecular chaperone DnaK